MLLNDGRHQSHNVRPGKFTLLYACLVHAAHSRPCGSWGSRLSGPPSQHATRSLGQPDQLQDQQGQLITEYAADIPSWSSALCDFRVAGFSAFCFAENAAPGRHGHSALHRDHQTITTTSTGHVIMEQRSVMIAPGTR